MPGLSRSEQMARVKASNTGPEMRVRKFLHSKGLRYRLHVKHLPGRPDIVFPSRRIVVFVHGCFWHQHQKCPNARVPKTRVEFWQKKLCSNVARDQDQEARLTQLGWTVLTIWECETRDHSHLSSLQEKIVAKPTVAPAERPQPVPALRRKNRLPSETE